MLDEYLGNNGSPVIETEEVCAEPQVFVHGRSSSTSNKNILVHHDCIPDESFTFSHVT